MVFDDEFTDSVDSGAENPDEHMLLIKFIWIDMFGVNAADDFESEKPIFATDGGDESEHLG